MRRGLELLETDAHPGFSIQGCALVDKLVDCLASAASIMEDCHVIAVGGNGVHGMAGCINYSRNRRSVRSFARKFCWIYC